MKTLTEKEAEDFLEEHGFEVTKRRLVNSKDELEKVKFSFPWVMKISSKHIVHKAKMGGTLLNIKTIEEAKIAFEKLSSIEKVEGIMIQPMHKGLELILGLKRTPEFNLVLMFGKGGSNVESDKDVVFRIPPLSRKEVENLIQDLKISKAIEEKTDKNLVIKNLLKMSHLSQEHPEILELDINPLIVNKEKATVVDARIIMN